MRSPFDGCYAPILTPFSDDLQSIDRQAFGDHLSFLKRSDLAGILVLGTNGEFAALSELERFELVNIALAEKEHLKLIVGATMPASRDGTLALVRRLMELGDGIDALLMAPPFFDCYAAGEIVPESQVMEFYRQAAAVCEGGRILLYNVPVPPAGRVTAPVSPAIVGDLATQKTIVGIKDSTGKPENVGQYLAANPSFHVLAGNDHAVEESFARGAVGSITACANVFPERVAAFHQAADNLERRAAQRQLSEYRRLLDMIPGKIIAVQKFLAFRLGILGRFSDVRAPNMNLTPAEANRVWEAYLRLAEGGE